MNRLLLAILCTAYVVNTPAQTPPSRIVLNYAFEPVVNSTTLVMHVLLEYKGAAIDTPDLIVPSSWGDATRLERGITNLKNEYHDGHVGISYDLVRAWEVPPARADHYPLLEPEYFEFNTQNALVHPAIESAAQVEVRLDWRKLPIGWSLATSFGARDRLQLFRGSWGEMNHALFAGGDFRLNRVRISGRPLVVAMRGKWLFTDDEVASRIQNLIALNRAFWHDYDFPYYLVTVSTFGREEGGAGGGAFTNAFALFLQPQSSFGYDVQSLLAHETFHTWNPYRMGATPDSSITMSWFTEGFTTYYQDLLLLRADMLEFPNYVQQINKNLRKYWFSPARNATNQEVIESHHLDSATDDIPYTRGALTALWLDWKIRETNRGKASLDDLMFDLVRQARKRKPALTADRVFGLARKYIDADAIEQLRGYVDLGKTIEFPTAALGPCATVELDHIPPFELGIDRDALASRRVVSGVKPGSAAYQAGLRDGQQVIGTSIYMNDVSKPVKLTIRTEAGDKTIQYYPRGTSSGPVPQYHLSAAALANPDQCTQDIRSGQRVR